MFDHVLKRGKRAGEHGYGWARPNARWCTSKLKTEVINKYLNSLSKTRDVVQCVGIAADEVRRVKDKRYPLVEYGITEKEALAYCYSHGYDWGGLYEKFGRVSCWCCPLQSLDDLRALRKDFPKLWDGLRDMDRKSCNSFRVGCSVEELEMRFSNEDKQTRIDFNGGI